MRDIQNIQVDEFIVHILDPGNEHLLPPDFLEGQPAETQDKMTGLGKRGLLLSFQPIAKAKNPDAYAFIKKQILSILKDHRIREAKFSNSGLNPISKTCNGIITDPRKFVEESKSLAEELFEIMEKNGRISACDLAVCLFHDKNEESKPKDSGEKAETGNRYLALLKLDLSLLAFRSRIVGTKSMGYVDLEQIDLVFTEELLQKAALIRAAEPESQFDLLLLDTQVKGSNVAKFFKDDFLKCHFTHDSKFLTLELNKALINVENLLWSTEKFRKNALDFSKFVKSAFGKKAEGEVKAKDRFQLDAWVDESSFSPELKEFLLDKIEGQLPDKDFELDQQLAERFLKKTRYVGDCGLIVEINTICGKSIDSTWTPPCGLNPGYWEICVKTPDLERVK